MKKTLILILSLVLLFVFAVPAIAETETLIGDANDDGLINTGDAVLVLRSIVGTRELSETQTTLADFNSDGKVNTGDAVGILISLVKEHFSAGEYKLGIITQEGLGEWILDDWFDDFAENHYSTSGLIIVIEDMETLKAFVDPTACKLRVAECEWGGFIGYPTFQSLEEITKQYDEEFFEKNILVFANFNEATNSLDFEVEDVKLKDSTLQIDVNQYYRELVTPVTGNNLVKLELSRELFQGIEDVEFTFNVVTIYD